MKLKLQLGNGSYEQTRVTSQELIREELLLELKPYSYLSARWPEIELGNQLGRLEGSTRNQIEHNKQRGHGLITGLGEIGYIGYVEIGQRGWATHKLKVHYDSYYRKYHKLICGEYIFANRTELNKFLKSANLNTAKQLIGERITAVNTETGNSNDIGRVEVRTTVTVSKPEVLPPNSFGPYPACHYAVGAWYEI